MPHIAGHTGAEEFNAGLREPAADTLNKIRGTQPTAAPQQGGGALTAEDILNILLRKGGQDPVPRQPTPPQEPTPLIDPKILAAMQSIIADIDPNLDIPPETLASFLTTTRDDLGKVIETGLFDRQARVDLQNFARDLSKSNIAAEQAETKAGAAAEKAERDAEDRANKAEDRARDEEDRQRQIESDQITIQQQEQNLTEQDIPKSTEALITKALAAGDFDLARKINDFRNEPTNAEKLRLALDFASSPSDVFTLSAIADGAFPGQFDKFEGIRSSPRSPVLNDLLDATLGVNQPAPEAAAPQQPAPEAFQPPPPVAEPAPLSSFRSPEAGGVPLQPQPFSEPALPPRGTGAEFGPLAEDQLAPEFGVEGPFRRSELQNTGFEEGGAFGPLPVRNPGVPTSQVQPVAPQPTGFQFPNALTGSGFIGQAEGFNDVLNTVRNLLPADSPTAGPGQLAETLPLQNEPPRFDEEGGAFPFLTSASHTPTHQKLVTSPSSATTFDTAKFGDNQRGQRFPASDPGPRTGQLPGIDPLVPPTPGLQDIPAQGLPVRNQPQGELINRAPFAGFIPEGTPTFNTTLDGQDIRLPQRFGTLFRGIKDPSQQLQRPQSALGFRGLPRPDPGTFSRLTAAEQDTFFALAQFAGADVRDVQREIESGRGAQPRFSRITSAATRSR